MKKGKFKMVGAIDTRYYSKRNDLENLETVEKTGWIARKGETLKGERLNVSLAFDKRYKDENGKDVYLGWYATELSTGRAIYTSAQTRSQAIDFALVRIKAPSFNRILNHYSKIEEIERSAQNV